MNCWIIARGEPKLKDWTPRKDWDIEYEYLGEDSFVNEPTAATNFASLKTAEALAERFAELDVEDGEATFVYRVLPRTGDIWTQRIREGDVDDDDWVIGVVAYIDEYHRWFAMFWKEGVFDPATDREGYPSAAAAKRVIDQEVAGTSYMRATGKWTTRDRTPWFKCLRGADAERYFEQAQYILNG